MLVIMTDHEQNGESHWLRDTFSKRHAAEILGSSLRLCDQGPQIDIFLGLLDPQVRFDFLDREHHTGSLLRQDGSGAMTPAAFSTASS